jgi:hypothetical protein
VSRFYHRVIQKASNKAMIFVVEGLQQMLCVAPVMLRLRAAGHEVCDGRSPGNRLALQVVDDERSVLLELCG